MIVTMRSDEMKNLDYQISEEVSKESEKIKDELNIIFSTLDIFLDFRRDFLPRENRNNYKKIRNKKSINIKKASINKSVDQFLKIYFCDVRQKGCSQRSLKIVKGLLEEELHELDLLKDTISDTAILAAAVIFISIFYLLSPASSQNNMQNISKNFAIISAMVSVSAIMIKSWFFYWRNKEIKKFRICLMSINQVIDRIEEDEIHAKKIDCKDIEQDQTLNLSMEDSTAFVDAVLNPPPPNAALKSAAIRYHQEISV